MSVALLEQAVAKKPDTSVRVDAESAAILNKAASLKGMTLKDYVRVALVPIARADLLAEAEKITKAAKRTDR